MKKDYLSHVAEIIELGDLQLVAEVGTLEQFIVRSKRNYDTKGIRQGVVVMDILV